MKAVVAAFILSTLVGAFSVITNLRMELFQAIFRVDATWLPPREARVEFRDSVPRPAAGPGGGLAPGGADQQPRGQPAGGRGGDQGAGHRPHRRQGAVHTALHRDNHYNNSNYNYNCENFRGYF